VRVYSKFELNVLLLKKSETERTASHFSEALKQLQKFVFDYYSRFLNIGAVYLQMKTAGATQRIDCHQINDYLIGNTYSAIYRVLCRDLPRRGKEGQCPGRRESQQWRN